MAIFPTKRPDGRPTLERLTRLLDEARGTDDHEGGVAKARTAAEALGKFLIEVEGERAEQAGLANKKLDEMITRISKLRRGSTPVVPALVLTELRVIQLYGNHALHDQGEASEIRAAQHSNCVNALEEVVRWFGETYLQIAPPEPVADDERGLPTTSIPGTRKKGLRKGVILQLRRLRPHFDAGEAEIALMAMNRALTLALTEMTNRLGLAVTGKEHLSELYGVISVTPGAIPKPELNALDTAVEYLARFHDLDALMADPPSSESISDASTHARRFVDWYIQRFEKTEEWVAYVVPRFAWKAAKAVFWFVVAIVVLNALQRGRF